MSLPFSVLRVRSFPAVNLMATGSTLLGTLENAERFVPVFLHLETSSLSGNIVTSPSISLGTTANGTDILATTVPTLSLLNGMNRLSQTNIVAQGSQSIAAGMPIYFNVTAAALGPSVLTALVDLLGYYR